MHRTPVTARTGTVRTTLAALAAAALATALPAPAAAAPAATAPPPRSTSAGPPVDLDVLFVGAHPDDEAFTLAAFGQWNEYHHVKTGVVTITRGEGGGNAVGPQEGPALGLIREGEERRAVKRAGISDVFNLDKVDFYYTVSSPLTEQIWGHESTLAKVVRVIRETRPEVLTTMDPAPSPGNHGHHQYAARLAVEAFAAAADPKAFPAQLQDEGLSTWRASKLLLGYGEGTSSLGPDCPSTFVPTDPAQDIYGVWSGRHSQRYDKSWAQVAREAQREYASQGWAGFPDEPSDPGQLGCNYFTLVASRVPFAPPDSHAAEAPTGALAGALVPAPGGLPLGTELFLTADTFHVVPGSTMRVTAHVRAPRDRGLGRPKVSLRLPPAWTSTGSGQLPRIRAGQSAATTFRVSAPAGAHLNARRRLQATMSSWTGSGYTDREVEVTPPAQGVQQPLAQIAQFQQWADTVGVSRLEGFVTPVLTIRSGGSRDVGIVVTNYSSTPQSGTVELGLPAGFSADDTSRPFAALTPGSSTTVRFRVRNSDASLPTSNEGGDGGDYGYTVRTTTSDGTTSMTQPALELVPTTTIPHASAAPEVDGMGSAGEYTGPTLDLSRVWEGSPCDSPADCSASAKVTWFGDALYVLVHVTDDVLGTRLDATDCKRHWRTDSVELAFDPRGRSENTSTTFKTGILPVTNDPAHGNPPCFERDADNHQGPGRQTAPGMTLASTVSSPYRGYTVETKIPMADLPGAVRPAHLGMNLFVYDSDTQDKTGQTRIGWSTWGGVQGDPYRWGQATVQGYTPPAGRSTEPPEPVIPLSALHSVDSPLSIHQAVRDNVPLAGGAAAPDGDSAWLSAARAAGGGVRVRLWATGPGRAHLFVRGGHAGTLGQRTLTVAGAGRMTVWLPLRAGTEPKAERVLMSFAGRDGGTLSSRRPVR